MMLHFLQSFYLLQLRQLQICHQFSQFQLLNQTLKMNQIPLLLTLHLFLLLH